MVTGQSHLPFCPICNYKAQLANQNQLVDHYASKHPKEKPPAESS